MPRKPLAAPLLTLVIVFSAAAYAQEASPPFPTLPEATSTANYSVEAPANTVTAIIVKSWGGNPVWADLNENWSTYGKIAVSIDYTSLIDSDFTYQDLVNSKADVVIISDPAGGKKQYSSAEFGAIAKYAKKGHSILATYLTFQYLSYDNRKLAPVFGLNSTLTYTNFVLNDFKRDAKACLLTKIPSSWQSKGFNFTQVPSDDTWKGSLDKAKAVADSDAFVGVISLYTTNTYTGVYVSNMPEYDNVGGYDEQLLYNAITCYVKK
jgi:hypothetical protein